ncbi:MAG TPA: tetratricopeptide repeat protein [Pyrinomonadaceae bacterium]|nr:tetratricopeptide repeat protein [Pyrinomonadaceae bacterium]
MKKFLLIGIILLFVSAQLFYARAQENVTATDSDGGIVKKVEDALKTGDAAEGLEKASGDEQAQDNKNSDQKRADAKRQPSESSSTRQTAPSNRTSAPAASGGAPQRASDDAAASKDSTSGDAAGADTPKDAEGYHRMGLAHYQSKRFKEAVDAYKQALRLKPNDAQTYFDLGMAYYHLSRYEDAAQAYRRATRIRPDWAEAYFRAGWMYYVLGKKQAALEQHRSLQKLDSELATKLNRILSVEDQPPSGSKVSAKSDVTDQPKVTDKSQSASPPAISVPDEVKTKSDPVETGSATNDVGLSASAASPVEVAAPSKNEQPSKTSVSTPTPASDAAPISIYRVGAGDVLDIRLLNSPTNRSTLYTVVGGGLIEYPLAGGPVQVAGLTTDEIAARLAAELKRRHVEENAEVIVSVREYASHTVIISGLVNYPGTKVLRREAVPLYVVLAEAQPRPEAGRALIMRSTGQSPVIDLTDPAGMSTLVYAGDVITVSARQLQYYFIGGRVLAPGQKVFQPGITLLQAILAAGGVSRPEENIVEVSREGADGRLTATRYSLKDIRSGKVPDPRLQPGDRIEVGR